MKKTLLLSLFRRISPLFLLAFAPWARASIIANGSFENVSPALATNGICTTNQTIYPSVSPGAYPACSATGWTGNYQIGNGKTIGVFGVSFGIPQPDPNGSNTLILQAERNVAPTATQSIDLPTTGNYALSFYVANRSSPAASSGPQTVSALLDGSVISGGVYSNLPDAWTLETLDFNASGGTHTLTFEGLDEASGAATANVSAFLDDASISPVTTATPEPSTLALLGLGLLAVAILTHRLTRTV